MHENFKLPLTRQKKKIKLGTISGIDQYGYAYNRAKFGACIKNRTIQELYRRTTRKPNPKKSRITFDTQLKTVLSRTLPLSVPCVEHYRELNGGQS